MVKRQMIVAIIGILTVFAEGAWSSTKPHVIFCGGYRATQEQMVAWKAGAEADPAYGSKFNFDAIPYPAKTSDLAAAEREGAATIANWAKAIDESPTSEKFILVGHSSGAAVCNAIARKAREKPKLEVIVLDGFAPSGLHPKVKTECWSAVSSDSPNLKAFNHPYQKTCAGNPAGFREIKFSGCDNPMCLHFSLVNKGSADAKVSKNNFPKAGYERLLPNLDWLAGRLPQTSVTQPSNQQSELVGE